VNEGEFMTGENRQILITKLVNYFENPRHAIANNEADTLKKLFEAVGTQYMLNLAEDIQSNGLLGNQQIVAVYDEASQKYIVYEGNRRIAAIKLLLNPDRFGFLDKATIDKAKKIAQQGNPPEVINCYITDEEEAFFIMERLHSGEDRGRGTKQWSSREKEAFRVRQTHEKNLSFLIDLYVKKYFNELNITTILPFTTIQRIFNNREIKKEIGLDVSDESTFTKVRMQIIVDAAKWIKELAEDSKVAVTRLFNKAREIEDTVLPWIQEYMKDLNSKDSQDDTAGISQEGDSNTSDGDSLPHKLGSDDPDDDNGSDDTSASGRDSQQGSQEGGPGATEGRAGGSRNLPYFFQGLDYGNLNPNDVDSHGVSAVCRELQLFSDRKLVGTYPIATTFLVRSVIEQSIIYYSKKHNIQGQNRLIWEDIKNDGKLSKIIKTYKRNLANYITDATARQYFMSLFGNYEDNVDPLNWVVHRPAEFQLPPRILIELPRKGLLALINFMLA